MVYRPLVNVPSLLAKVSRTYSRQTCTARHGTIATILLNMQRVLQDVSKPHNARVLIDF